MDGGLVGMIGERLGCYEIESELGSGGMGRVFAATVAGAVPGLDPGARVALKVVHPHLLASGEFAERLRREAELGRTVRHENVVRTFRSEVVGEAGSESHLLVMEYVEGQTLRELLNEVGRVPEELARHIGRKVAQGLAAIHAAGAMHRDLKPDNVIVARCADRDYVVKIMDLGVARLHDEAVRLSQTGAFVGSIHYAAPEQFGDGAAADERADLHALGLLLYEIAAGRHPFHDEDFRVVLQRLIHELPRRVAEINPQLSPFFEEVVHTLLAKDPADRFPSADAVARVLEEGEDSAWWRDRARELRARAPLRRIRIPRDTGVHGREAELADLREAFESAAGGEGRVVLVTGEAGIGKSRLVDEFVSRLHEEGRDLNFLVGTYPPGGAATGGGAFSSAYREHFGAEGLEETLAAYLGRCPRLIPAFAAILRGDPAPPDEPPLTKDSLQTVFVEATAAIAARLPTIVAIEDLHFTPSEGRALFAALALAVPGHRVLLIGTARPELPEGWLADVTRPEHASHLPLTRLGPKDLVRLLGEAFHSERLAHELAGRIAVKSDGNPFFVFEIVRGLREGQFITQADDGTWILTRVVEHIRIPSSVMDLIQARIRDLSEEERDLLDVAACCGFEFDPLLVAAALDMKQVPAMKRLARIEQRQRLVRSAGRGFVFDHHQVQEALYSALPPLLREPYHVALATALEERERALERDPRTLDGSVAVDLCEGFLAGACGERALRYLDAAIEHLESGHLRDTAVALGDRALAVPDLLEGTARGTLLLAQADRLELLGRPAAEHAALEEALGIGEQHDAALAARAHVRLGWFLSRVGRLAEAEETAGRALERTRRLGDRALEAKALGSLGKLYFRQARYEEAQAHQQRSLELARECGDRAEEAVALGGLGNVLALRGRHEEARRLFEAWRELAREIGQRRGEAMATGNLGAVLIGRGYLADARTNYEERLSMAQEDGDRRGAVVALLALGTIAGWLGDVDEGRELIEHARRLSREIGVPRLESYAIAELADVAETAGDLDDAERLCREALRLRTEIDYRAGLPVSLTALGGVLVAAGRPEEARPLLERACELARATGSPETELLALCHLAATPWGDVAEADRKLRLHDDSIDHHRRMWAHFALWKAGQERRHLETAHRLLDHLRDHAPEDRRGQMIESVPLHRAIRDAWRR